MALDRCWPGLSAAIPPKWGWHAVASVSAAVAPLRCCSSAACSSGLRGTTPLAVVRWGLGPTTNLAPSRCRSGYCAHTAKWCRMMEAATVTLSEAVPCSPQTTGTPLLLYTKLQDADRVLSVWHVCLCMFHSVPTLQAGDMQSQRAGLVPCGNSSALSTTGVRNI